jgi:hypothetical protein
MMTRTLLIVSLLVGLPTVAGAQSYPGLIIPIEQAGVEFKIEITADDKAGPFDLRIWRLDGKSMRYQRKKARELAALACESEGYQFDRAAVGVVTGDGEIILKAGCKA